MPSTSLPTPHPSPTPRTPFLFWAVLVLSTLAALAPAFFPAIDVFAASLFAGPQAAIQAREWWWVAGINLYVPAVFRGFLVVVLIALVVAACRKTYRTWRIALATVLISGILGPGMVVNWGLKENWQRARPYEVSLFGGQAEFTRATVIANQCNNNCSFVSGHVACGFFFSGLLLVHRRRQRMWLAIGTASGLTIGFARMADMAHWLSDVLWAYPVVLMVSWLVWKAIYVAVAAHRRHFPPNQDSPSKTVG